MRIWKSKGAPWAVPLDLDSSLRDTGISSLDFVAFAKLVATEFDVEVSMEECASISSVRELIAFLDAKAA